MDTEQGRPVALVSGGSRGIGRAVVLRLAAEGYDVGFCYHSDKEAASEVCAAAAPTGAKLFYQQVDVADGDAVRGFVAATEDELGPVDAVVTSAGIVRDNPLVLMTPDDWREVREVNLDGTYHVCRAAVFSMMKRRTGNLVTLSSVVGQRGNATQSNYAATKAGIIGFTLSLARELGRFNIRANTVAPGIIDTAMTAALTSAKRDTAVARVPLGRMGTADEVADTVVFLVSDRARYITGQVIGVDGGIVL
jgi:3-oxoacyl-[acyl-carrier protein] reductase